MLNRRTLPIIDDDDPIWIDKVTRKFLNMTPMSFPSKSHFGSPKPVAEAAPGHQNYPKQANRSNKAASPKKGGSKADQK